jgi:nicotinamide riboside transporter PnuC
MHKTVLAVLPWIATVFSFAGIFYNAHRHRFCWPIWIVADALWFLLGALTGQYAICVLHTGYMLSNFYGMKKWKRPICEEGAE